MEYATRPRFNYWQCKSPVAFVQLSTDHLKIVNYASSCRIVKFHVCFQTNDNFASLSFSFHWPVATETLLSESCLILFMSICLQDCMYLHELGDGAGSFTKDDMQAGLVFCYWCLNYSAICLFCAFISWGCIVKVILFSCLFQETPRIWTAVNCILFKENVSFMCRIGQLLFYIIPHITDWNKQSIAAFIIKKKLVYQTWKSIRVDVCIQYEFKDGNTVVKLRLGPAK